MIVPRQSFLAHFKNRTGGEVQRLPIVAFNNLMEALVCLPDGHLVAASKLAGFMYVREIIELNDAVDWEFVEGIGGPWESEDV